jgi:uncharacterized GH25 family protein
VGWAAAVQAHELWLLPSTLDPEPGEEVPVEIRIGSGWPGEAVQRNPQRVRRFNLVDAGGERALPRIPGNVPAAVAPVRRPGAAWLVYRTVDIPIEIDAPTFEKYLGEEGLEHVSAMRRAAGQADRPGRERYSRCAKTLLRVGGRTAGWDRRLGLALEIMPLRDPARASANEPLPLRVLLQGEPREGLLVRAMPRRADRQPVQARTAKDGSVTLPLDGGVWLINVVHMERAPGGMDADWRSVWSSLLLRTGP